MRPSGRYGAAPPRHAASGGYPAVPPAQRASGGFPAVPPRNAPPAGPYPPAAGPPRSVPPGYPGTRPSGRFPSPPRPPPSSSGYPAVPPPHTASGGYPAVPPPHTGSGGYPAVPPPHTGSGGYPAVPPPHTGSGGYAAVPPPHTGSGGYAAVPQTASGRYPAVPQTASGGYPAVPQTASGGYPAVPSAPPGGRPAAPRHTSSGGYPALPQRASGRQPRVRPSGRFAAQASSGAHAALRPSGRFPLPLPPERKQLGPHGDTVGDANVLPLPEQERVPDLGRTVDDEVVLPVPAGAEGTGELDLGRTVSDEQVLPTPSRPKRSKQRRITEQRATAGVPQEGDTFDGFRIGALLGQGNMGRIYRARDSMNRDVALKVILAEIASEEGLARFEREGQAMASIRKHPNVVAVHTTGRVGGMPYLVLDFVAGESLDAIIRRGPLGIERAVSIAEHLARALAHVHQAGVLHRDLKPANVIVRHEDDQPVLTDFGLAGLAGADRLTKTGDMLGTPLYMAPEQALGLHKQVDERTDVWALGVMLYEMLTGQVPFPGRTVVDVSQAITKSEPAPIRRLRPEVDSGLEGVVANALAKDKAERIPSPADLAAALRTWRQARAEGRAAPVPVVPRRRRRRTLAGLGVTALLAAGAGGGALWWQNQRAQSPAEEDGAGGVAAVSTREAAEFLSREAQALKAVNEALSAGDLRVALLELEPVAERVAQDASLREEAEALRARILVQALELCADEQRANRLEQALRLVSLLNPGLDPIPPGSELADAVIARVTRIEAAARRPLSNPLTLRLVLALTRAELEPHQVPALLFLERFLFHTSTRDESFARDYYTIVVALARLQVDLQHEHFKAVGWTEWTEHPEARDTVARYVHLLLERTPILEDPNQGPARTKLRKRIHKLLRQESQGLGPRTQAYAKRSCAHLSALDPSEVLRLLREAVQATPDNPRNRVRLSEALYQHAGLLVQGRPPPERAEVEAFLREAIDHAERAREDFARDGWHKLTSGLELNMRAVRALAHLYTALGTQEKLNRLCEEVPRLQRSLGAARQWRAKFLQLYGESPPDASNGGDGDEERRGSSGNARDF